MLISVDLSGIYTVGCLGLFAAEEIRVVLHFQIFHLQISARSHGRGRGRVRCVSTRKGSLLIISQLGYYHNGNRTAVLLYRLFSIRIVSKKR